MNSVEALEAEIAEFEYSIKVRKDALVLIKGGMHKTEDAKPTEVKPPENPRRKNIHITNKQVYRTKEDKKYLENVICEALGSVKRPKNAKWVFENNRNKQGLRTHAGIALKMKEMADRNILRSVKPKSRKEGMLYEVDIPSTVPPKEVPPKEERQKIHIGHGTGKGHTNAALGEGV